MKQDFFTIRGFSQSAYAELTNPDGRLKVELPTAGSGLTDTELRAAAVPVIQASGSVNSTNILQVLGNPVVVGTGYQDNALRIVMATDAIASVNVVSGSTAGTEYVDEGTSPLPSGGLMFLRDSLTSTYAAVSGAGYADSRTIRVVHATDVGLSTNATQTGTWNIGTVTTVTGVTNSLAASVVDSSGVQYSGSNPVPITIVSGALTSTIAVGAVVTDAADDGSAPVKIGGIARTANPTAVAGGDSVSSSYDDIGRIITRPVQVRDLLTTATATLTTGTETTLLASAASTYNDLIYIMGANNSDAAATVDIRSGTANSVLMTLQIPANGTAGVSLPVPLPQETAQATWTADMNDITGTTVYVSALFSKEV